MIICGHNYERHFGKLKYFESGDEIIFTDVNGNAFTYQVEEVITFQPTDVEEMLSQESGEWDLPLHLYGRRADTRDRPALDEGLTIWVICVRFPVLATGNTKDSDDAEENIDLKYEGDNL